jgi:methylated-DNA-[protein]-cysteine S-methyltransferase
MSKFLLKDDREIARRLRSAFIAPPGAAVSKSRMSVKRWYSETAPLIQWGEMSSPLGKLFVAVNARGLCAVDFGRRETDFLRRLDPQSRLEKNPKAVQPVTRQLLEYFAQERTKFDLPIDLSVLTPFQRNVLDIACRIAPGRVWTYHRVAEEMGRPKSSRPVGQALARNPVPIIIPCHRVIASDGTLGGYSGGSGLKAKRWLLRLEGALS